MTQEERLFGAPNRHIGLISLTTMYQPHGNGSVVVQMQPAGRKQMTTLHVVIGPDDSPGPVLGILQPLLQLWYVTPARWAQLALKASQRLGGAGYEHTIS